MTVATHILLATDLSAASDRAVATTLELAKLTGARVTVAHVYLAAPAGLGYATPESSEPPNAMDEALSEALRALRDEQLAELQQVELQLIAGTSAVDALCRYARDNAVDLIVVASHGRTGLAHLLIGSVAEKVVRHSACSVIVAR